MGLLSNLFSRIAFRYYLPGSSAGITAYDKQAYDNELCRAIIDTIATHAAKAEAMHVIVDKDGRIKKIIHDSPYAKLLNQQPNSLMTGYDLKYRLFSQLEQYTGAFCYMKWNGTLPEMALPIDYVNLQILPIQGGGFAIEFMEKDGTQTTLNLEDVIVLRKLFGQGDVLGDGNSPLTNTLSMIKAADEGNMQALSVSNKVRGLLKQKKGMLSPEDVQKSTDEFGKRFAKAATSGGIVGVDSMEDFTPLNAQTLTLNAPLLIETKKNLNRYWHVAEAIVLGDYTDTQFQAFFEGAIEPKLIEASQAFTNGYFTRREKDVGNRLIFNTSIMMHASIQNKLNLVRESRETGMLTVNEQRSLFGFSPVEGGDVRQVSLNYVKDKDQSKYQTGENPPEGNEDDGQDKSDRTQV